VIKYLGSKRRLVPALTAIASASRANTAVDLFTGTTRVAQALKSLGIEVTAVDSARYSEAFARCYIGTDADNVDHTELSHAVDELDAVPGEAGYVTDVFARQARYFQPHNAARIDAIRDAIARRWTGHPFEPILLTSLVEAADRVDSTTGVQMAFVKQWAPRSQQRMRLRVPALLVGSGHAVRGDACTVAHDLGHVDLAYLDPPYNQHRYTANYHVWETLVAWDAPPHYGVACKRADLRDPSTRSVFNSRRTMPAALHQVIDDLSADLLVVSCSNEGWVGVDELRAWCEPRGCVEVMAFDSRRYVGAQIGVFNPQGERVGEVSHLHNVEYLVLSGERALVRRAVQSSSELTSASTSASGSPVVAPATVAAAD
jgi:adenine-specific DNA-methyltransferase